MGEWFGWAGASGGIRECKCVQPKLINPIHDFKPWKLAEMPKVARDKDGTVGEGNASNQKIGSPKFAQVTFGWRVAQSGWQQMHQKG